MNLPVKIVENQQHLAKLWAKVTCFFDSQCTCIAVSTSVTCYFPLQPSIVLVKNEKIKTVKTLGFTN